MEWLTLFINNYPSLIFFIVFLAVVAEGDVSLLLFGALGKEKILKFWQVYVIAIFAAMLHDVIFWSIGRWLSKTQRKQYLFFNLEKVSVFLEKIRPMAGMYIFTSKFAWNFNRVVLVACGYIGIEFKKFIKFSIPVAFVWPLVFLSLGYVFADQTDIFKQKLEYAGLFIIGFLAFFTLFEIYLKKYILKLFIKTPEEKD